MNLEGSTEETETSSIAGAKPYNRLGEDLLRMFLEEINPDVTIDVAGRHIRAHKCILSSRCQYFAAILSGGWIESAGNVISLQGYVFTIFVVYSRKSSVLLVSFFLIKKKRTQRLLIFQVLYYIVLHYIDE